jgi:hypothetical protein
VFCVDEKTAIQALDRLDPVLPLSPGWLERHGFEYYRGTERFRCTPRLTAKAARWWAAAHHSSQEFVAFLADLVANQPRGKEIHIIADNLWAHKTMRVEQFLAAHPNCTSTTRRPTLPGSTKSKTGSPSSSARGLPSASSPRLRTWPAS